MGSKLWYWGGTYKLIVNAGNIKSLCEDMRKNNVTKFATVFIDKGGRRYDTDHEQTEILAVGGRDIEADEEGYPVYSDTKEKVTFNQ